MKGMGLIMFIYVIVGLIAYCLGSISFSVIFTKKIAGFDVREKGSKNAGSTNVLRTAGKKAAALTLICDILKGVVAVLIAFFAGKLFNLSNTEIAILLQIAAIASILGHMFPVFFQFKGGKGVATSLGILLILNWKIGLICLIFALLIMAITKMVSLGSISAAILFPILVVFISDGYLVNDGYYLVGALIIALLVIFSHRANIKRIVTGKENKLSFRK